MFNLNRHELKLLKRLNSPRKIQDYLLILPQNFERGGDTCRSVRQALAKKEAHCIEGALLAAAALWVNGEAPLLFDLRSRLGDQDHIVALFRQYGHWGAISKTNHAVLRYREPIYKTLRELALSYFHEYFLDTGAKTLREYSAKPFDLRKFRKGEWLAVEDDMWDLVEAIDNAPHKALLTPAMIKTLRKADKIEIQAGRLVEWKKK
ncbi:MAG: hypothetical protein AAB880_00955 [Patescibacteria group bacterium]